MTTLADVIGAATEAGEYVNAPFEAVVLNVKPKDGKRPQKADICDPKNPRTAATMAIFGGSLMDFKGSIVRFGGKGIKAKLYEGKVEISINDKTSVLHVGDAPATSTPTGGESPPAGKSAPAATPPRDEGRPAGDPVADFHKPMKKISLLYLHSYQYATDVQVRLHGKLTPEQFQACIASVFITAKDQGALRAPIPALREADGVGFKTFIAVRPTVDPKAAEEAARVAAEAAAELAAKAAREKAAKAHAENLDEDVPF